MFKIRCELALLTKNHYNEQQIPERIDPKGEGQKMPKIDLYGHQAFPHGLTGDIALAAISLVMLILLLRAEKQSDRVIKWSYRIMFGAFFPNSTYLFLEVKHLLFLDNVADKLEPEAVQLFLTLSALGLIITLTEIYVAATQLEYFKKDTIMAIVILSSAASWGAVLGLMDLQSIDGIILPVSVIIFSINAAKVPAYWVLFFVLSSILSTLTILLKACIERYLWIKHIILQKSEKSE